MISDREMDIVACARDVRVSVSCLYLECAWFVYQDMFVVRGDINLTRDDILFFLQKRWGKDLKLELGPGKANHGGPPWGKKQMATIGLNTMADPNSDVYKDLDVGWWDDQARKDECAIYIPLPDECIAEIHANQFFEHISNIIPLMNDC